jgi:hypothetical protein
MRKGEAARSYRPRRGVRSPELEPVEAQIFRRHGVGGPTWTRGTSPDGDGEPRAS